MRGKGYLQGIPVLGDTYEGTALASQRGIVSRDFFDVRRVDAVFANFLGAKRVSIGSVFELAWAFQLQKPVVLAMEDSGNIHEHAFVREACAFRLPTLEAAVETLVRVVTPGL
jgi:nucleoside 2-deoxyribosyltransferase